MHLREKLRFKAPLRFPGGVWSRSYEVLHVKTVVFSGKARGHSLQTFMVSQSKDLSDHDGGLFRPIAHQ